MFETTPVIKLGDHFKKVSYSFLFFFGMGVCLCFFVDPTVPEEVQEDSQDFRT